MLAPLPLRPPPRPAILRAWNQPLRHLARQQTARAAFLHAGTANSTSWCCGASQRLHAHAARPDAIIYPMGHKE